MKQKSEMTTEELEKLEKKLKKLQNLNQEQAVEELKKAVLALNYETVKFLLENYSFNFNEMKSVNGHGFLFTFYFRRGRF